MDTAVATVTGRKPGPGPGHPTPDSRVVPFLLSDWIVAPATELQRQAEAALEDGKVLFFPRLGFPLKADESRFLDPALAGSAKNVSFNLATRKLGKSA